MPSAYCGFVILLYYYNYTPVAKAKLKPSRKENSIRSIKLVVYKGSIKQGQARQGSKTG